MTLHTLLISSNKHSNQVGETAGTCGIIVASLAGFARPGPQGATASLNASRSVTCIVESKATPTCWGSHADQRPLFGETGQSTRLEREEEEQKQEQGTVISGHLMFDGLRKPLSPPGQGMRDCRKGPGRDTGPMLVGANARVADSLRAASGCVRQGQARKSRFRSIAVAVEQSESESQSQCWDAALPLF